MPASIVDVLEKTEIGLDEIKFARGVDTLEFCFDALALVFPSAEEVNARLLCVFGELFECSLPDPTRCAHEDCDEPSRKIGGNQGVGSAHQIEENHGGCAEGLTTRVVNRGSEGPAMFG